MVGKTKAALLALATLGAFITAPAVASGDEYFEGKTIDIVIPFSPGGSADLFARLIANKLQQHIPGNPNVKAINRPGAGGVLGANAVYNSGITDGTQVLVTSIMPWMPIIGNPSVLYDTEKFEVLAALGEPEVLYVASRLDIQSPEDLINNAQVLRAGADNPTSSKAIIHVLLSQILGYEIKSINGYPSAAETRLAVRRGEADMGMESLAGFYVAIEGDADFTPIMQLGVPDGKGGYIEDPRLQEYDLPTMFEVIKDHAGIEALNSVETRALEITAIMYGALRTISLPPNTDPEAVNVLQVALTNLFADPEFVSDAIRVNGYPVSARLGKDADEFVADLTQRVADDEEAIALLRKIAGVSK